MSALAAWLERHIRQSPATLAARTREYALAAEPSGAIASSGAVAETLANGARAAVATALAQPADRSAALDLLAGDALVTLALLAQAEAAPEHLGDFARALLRPDRLAP